MHIKSIINQQQVFVASIRNSIKYKNIISQLFPEKKTNRKKLTFDDVDNNPLKGDGLKKLLQQQQTYKNFKKSGKFNYIYWDDPNELVDRLRLIVASQAAGHTGHTNEIISIIEELREANIIV